MTDKTEATARTLTDPAVEAVAALQWAPSGNLLDGIPTQVLRFLSKDGKTFGYGGGPGNAMNFGTPHGRDVSLRPRQWVYKRADGTFGVSDVEPKIVPTSQPDDAARAEAESRFGSDLDQPVTTTARGIQDVFVDGAAWQREKTLTVWRDAAWIVGHCARCTHPIAVRANDPENHEMDVCGPCGYRLRPEFDREQAPATPDVSSV